jgi:hypothetical protein
MKSIALMIRVTVVLVGIAGVAACSERDQSQAASARKPDTKPWQAAPTPYTTKGWTAGDKTNWEAQLRNRAQTQNEYAKVE